MSLFWIGWEKVKFWLGTGSLLNIFRSEVEFLISKSPPLDLFRKNLSNQTCITLMPPPINHGFTSIILTVEITFGKWYISFIGATISTQPRYCQLRTKINCGQSDAISPVA